MYNPDRAAKLGVGNEPPARPPGADGVAGVYPLKQRRSRNSGRFTVRVLWTVLVLIVVLVLLGTWLVFSGQVDVAARPAQSGIIDRLLQATQERSVAARANRLALPDLAAASVPLGASHYREMCVVCHGGPGTPRSEIGKGLDPSPPTWRSPRARSSRARSTGS